MENNVEVLEQLSLNLDPEYIVVQNNSLVFSNYDMTAMEQKIVLILVSTIKKNDTSIKQTSFRVQDLASLLEITPEGLYKDLPKICKSIMSKIIDIKNDNNDWEMFNLISYAKYKAKEGRIILEINKKAEPYLLQLKEYFTSFKLGNALFLDSKYAIRIYQLTKGSQFKKQVSFELHEFRKMLGIDKKTAYDRFSNITTRILKPSILEINSKTDIIIDYEVLKTGTKAVGIKFLMKPKAITEVAITTVKRSKNKKTSGFTDYEQREYDFDDLEKKLLGWDK